MKHWIHFEVTIKSLIQKQEFGDDLSVCALNILPKVSSLPMLLAINLMKVEI